MHAIHIYIYILCYMYDDIYWAVRYVCKPHDMHYINQCFNTSTISYEIQHTLCFQRGYIVYTNIAPTHIDALVDEFRDLCNRLFFLGGGRGSKQSCLYGLLTQQSVLTLLMHLTQRRHCGRCHWQLWRAQSLDRDCSR